MNKFYSLKKQSRLSVGSEKEQSKNVVCCFKHQLSFIVAMLAFVSFAFSQPGQQVYTTGSGTWTVPIGVTEITVECIGGGGRGSQLSSNMGGGGGGGGAYARSVITVSPFQQYAYTVGGGSTSTGAGGTTTFGTGPLVRAVGGNSLANNTAAGATGGSAASCIGDVVYSGGNGADGVSGSAGGGGGGAAGTAGDGNNGGSPNIYSGGAANSPGGAGGAGRSGSQGNGTAGSNYGGGGGGAYRTSSSTRTPGNGAGGYIRISYTVVHCTGPTLNATNATLSPLNSDNVTLNWISGDGTGGRVVVLKQGSAVNSDPIPDFTYTANAAFGAGQQLGTGNYFVYNGTGSSVNISNLIPSTLYHYAIYEYNTEGVCYTLTPLRGSFTTASCSPNIQASSISFPCPEYNEMTMNFTRGNGSHVLVLARAGAAVNAGPAYNTSYTANAQFGSGSQIGTGNYVVYNGNASGATSVQLTGLNPNTTYHFSVYEYNASPNCYSTSPVTASQATRSAGTYTSSTVAQVTNNVNPWTVDQQIVSLNVVVGGGLDAATVMNSITFNTTGSTNTANISAAKIFYTGTTNTFSAKTQFGETINNPSGTHTVTGTMTLAPAGTHYFWVTYDLIENAVLGNAVDAQVTSFNLTDFSGTSNRTPSTTSPTGVRTISNPSAPSGYCTPSAGTSLGQYIYGAAMNGTTYPAVFSGAYNNQTAATPATVAPGQVVPFSATYYDDVLFVTLTVWVDWNQNGTFENTAAERLLNHVYSNTNNINITVPADAVPGPTRMRVMAKNNETYGPCDTSGGTPGQGHIIDYTVFVTGGTSGPPVVCLTPAPTVTPVVTYTQGAVASPLSASGTGLLWYTAPTGGTGSAVAPTPSTTAVGTSVYYVSSTDGCESPRTQISVRVVPAPCGPTIETQPAAGTAGCYAGYTQINVEATGAIGYQWQFSMNGGTTWYNVSNNTKYSGATTSTLTITNPLASYNGYLYRVIVNGTMPVISETSLLSVQNCPTNDNPSITNPSLSLNYVYPNNIQIAGTTDGATINLETGMRDVWYRVTPISNAVSIRVSSSVIDPVLYLFHSDDMTTPVDVENLTTGTGTEIMNATGLQEGQLYYLAVASDIETDGDFTIVVQHLRKPQCTANTNVSLCELIQTSVTGAHSTKFEFTDINTSAITSYTGTGNSMLGSVSSAALRYGSTYNAHYTANYNLQNGLGETETIAVPNTQSCSITIGAHREVVVKVNNRCSSGAVLTRAAYLNGEFVGAGGQCNITGFEYEFTPVANCAGDDPQVLDKFSKTVSNTTPTMSLNYAFNHMPLAQNPNLGYWSVKMRPRFSGYSGTYGAAYVVAVNGTSPSAGSMALNNAPVANAVMPTVGEMDANIYPNPNSGELVNLNITGFNSNEVYVRILDSMGREVYTNRYAVDGSLNTMVNFGQSLSQGLYMVEMRAGETVKTQRMVVTK